MTQTACPTASPANYRLLLIAPEEVCGENVADIADYLALNAYDLDSIQPSTGTGHQSRSPVQRGFGGEVAGVDGSRGWAATFNAEVNIVEDQAKQAMALLLLASGLQGTLDTAVGQWLFAPYNGRSLSTAPAAFSSGVINPFALSMADVDRGGVVRRIRGVTGSPVFNLTVGERVELAFGGVGLLVNRSIVSIGESYDGQDFADLPKAGGTLPLVLRECTLSFEGEGPNDIPINLSTMSIDLNANVEQPADARPGGNGLGVVLPSYPEGPRVSYTLAESVQNRAAVMNRILNGETFALQIRMETEDGLGLEFDFPRLQEFEPRTVEEQANKRMHAVTAKAVISDDAVANDAFAITLDYKPQSGS